MYVRFEIQYMFCQRVLAELQVRTHTHIYVTHKDLYVCIQFGSPQYLVHVKKHQHNPSSTYMYVVLRSILMTIDQVSKHDDVKPKL